MKVEINKEYDLTSLKDDLTQAFPNYKIFSRGNKMLVVQKSNMVGANIMIGKPTHVRVIQAVPNQLSMFLMLLLLLAVLLPGVIVMLIAKSKQKAVVNEVSAYIKKNYNTTGTSSSQTDLLDQ
jgi:hypothetical protein